MHLLVSLSMGTSSPSRYWYHVACFCSPLTSSSTCHLSPSLECIQGCVAALATLSVSMITPAEEDLLARNTPTFVTVLLGNCSISQLCHSSQLMYQLVCTDAVGLTRCSEPLFTLLGPWLCLLVLSIASELCYASCHAQHVCCITYVADCRLPLLAV